MQMWDRVPVWNCGAIKASVISAWAPITRFLRNHVQRGGPRTAGWADYPDLLQVVKLCFGLFEFRWGQMSRASCDGGTFRTNVMRHRMADLQTSARGRHEVREGVELLPKTSFCG